MELSGLEFCTTKELIEELMRRKTFLGVVVHAEEELKAAWQGERIFKVRFNDNLNAGEAFKHSNHTGMVQAATSVNAQGVKQLFDEGGCWNRHSDRRCRLADKTEIF